MAYISSTGQIYRFAPSLRYLSIPRLIFLMLTGALLWITNPGNEHSIQFWTKGGRRSNVAGRNEREYRKKSRSRLFSFKFLGVELDVSMNSSFEKPFSGAKTNFEFFSLDKRLDGVWIEMLQHDTRICRFDNFYDNDTVEGALCAWLANNMCHGMKMFSPRRRDFTAHRIISYMLIGCHLLFLMCSVPTVTGAVIPVPVPLASMDNLYRRPLLLPASVFFHSNVLFDLISLNTFVYETLVRLNKFTSVGRTDSEASVHFYINVAFLIGVIGAFANLAASMVSGRGEFGFNGAAAASLGFQMATSPRATSITLFGRHYLSGECLVAMVVLHVILGRKGMGNVISWVIGGVVGSAWGDFFKDRLIHGGLSSLLI